MYESACQVSLAWTLQYATCCANTANEEFEAGGTIRQILP